MFYLHILILEVLELVWLNRQMSLIYSVVCICIAMLSPQTVCKVTNLSTVQITALEDCGVLWQPRPTFLKLVLLNTGVLMFFRH